MRTRAASPRTSNRQWCLGCRTSARPHCGGKGALPTRLCESCRPHHAGDSDFRAVGTFFCATHCDRHSQDVALDEYREIFNRIVKRSS